MEITHPAGGEMGKTAAHDRKPLCVCLAADPNGLHPVHGRFVTLLLRMGRTYRWRVAIMGGIVTAVSTYGVFGALLNVQFPKGPWGF